MLRAPASLRRVRFEVVDGTGAPADRGALLLASETHVSGDNAPFAFHREVIQFMGAAALGQHLSACCTKAGLSVAADGNAVAVSR